ncbi:hypothetical protein K0M31_006396 [Melipona bicolor]|uniref:Uncharacterized protein n=1 Tax=Melipona bicolor TaxID=60889 RepID=A0AA40FTP6_9HYME|nr:hypothetical protein K0M31_006396 [Melipona bicolor]
MIEETLRVPPSSPILFYFVFLLRGITANFDRPRAAARGTWVIDKSAEQTGRASHLNLLDVVSLVHAICLSLVCRCRRRWLDLLLSRVRSSRITRPRQIIQNV